MKLKTFLMPLLVVVAMAAWAYTPPMAKSKIVRTKQGVIIVPQEARMSNEDAKKIVQILKGYGNTAGYVRYFSGKNVVTYGALNMENLKALETRYKVSLVSGGRVPMGYFLIDEKVHKEAIDKKVVSGFKASGEIGRRLKPILAKYE